MLEPDLNIKDKHASKRIPVTKSLKYWNQLRGTTKVMGCIKKNLHLDIKSESPIFALWMLLATQIDQGESPRSMPHAISWPWVFLSWPSLLLPSQTGLHKGSEMMVFAASSLQRTR